MPFIAQCPHADCRKYQLLEDALRGAVTHCLLCKQPLRVTDGAGGPQAEAVAAPPPIRTAAPPPIRTAAPPPIPTAAPPPIRSAAPPISAAAPPAASPPRAGVTRCPQCAVELKLPWEKPVGSVRCPKCGAVFSP